MSPLRQALSDYLRVRRALGYKLKYQGYLLAQFVTYLDDIDAHTITIPDAVAWARLPVNPSPSWVASRLSAVRCFAAYLQTLDPTVEVPPVGLLPASPAHATPYLYSEDEILALITAAGSLRFPLQAATYQTLIGLLAVTGMRVGEAIRLNRDAIDLEHGLLVVHNSKFGKSRELPLHQSTIQALEDYLRERDQVRYAPSEPAVFISTRGTRLVYITVQKTFKDLVGRADLKPRSACCRPRLHDLRHSFAVATMLDFYKTDGDVQARLSLLSTYLGHVDPKFTYWYMSAAPELLGLAGQRLERHLGGNQ